MFSVLGQQMQNSADYEQLRAQMFYTPIAGHSGFVYTGSLPARNAPGLNYTMSSAVKQHMSRVWGGSRSNSNNNNNNNNNNSNDDDNNTDSSENMDGNQSSSMNPGHRRARRVFVPDEQKDEYYWSKRLKNNDSARRSRAKRKAMESQMEQKLTTVQEENELLKRELQKLRKRLESKEKAPRKEDVAIVKTEMIDPEYDLVKNSDKRELDFAGQFDRESFEDDDESVADKSDDSSVSSFSSTTDYNDYRNDNSLSSANVSDSGESKSGNSSTSRSPVDNYVSDSSERSVETDSKDRDRFLHRLPHKFRLKIHKHSAFY